MRYSPRVPSLSKLSSLFVLIWIPVMLLPTILAEDSPHFLRAVGVLPVALIVPAIGLEYAGAVVGRARPARVELW